MAAKQLPEYTIDEVALHSSPDSAWIVFRGEVLDVTKFLAEHPGGETPLLEALGMDSTERFDAVGHSSDAEEMAKQYVIGKLKTTGTEPKKCNCKLLSLTKKRDFALYLVLPAAVVLTSLVIVYLKSRS